MRTKATFAHIRQSEEHALPACCIDGNHFLQLFLAIKTPPGQQRSHESAGSSKQTSWDALPRVPLLLQNSMQPRHRRTKSKQFNICMEGALAWPAEHSLHSGRFIA